MHHTVISLIFNELCGRNSQWQLRSKHREILYSILIREMAERGRTQTVDCPSPVEELTRPTICGKKMKPSWSHSRRLWPSHLPCSPRVRASISTPRYQRPRPPVFFQTSRSWRLLLSRYALEAYATALERRGTASPRPTKPETIETMKVWEPCWCGSSTTEQRGSMKVRVANRANRVWAESPLLAAANRN